MEFYKKALEGSFNWYREAASKMDSIALYQLAGCYARGHGTEQDLQKSLQLLEQSSEQGCWGSHIGVGGLLSFWLVNVFLGQFSLSKLWRGERTCDSLARAFYLYHRIAHKCLKN